MYDSHIIILVTIYDSHIIISNVRLLMWTIIMNSVIINNMCRRCVYMCMYDSYSMPYSTDVCGCVNVCVWGSHSVRVLVQTMN